MLQQVDVPRVLYMVLIPHLTSEDNIGGRRTLRNGGTAAPKHVKDGRLRPCHISSFIIVPNCHERVSLEVRRSVTIATHVQMNKWTANLSHRLNLEIGGTVNLFIQPCIRLFRYSLFVVPSRK